VCPALTTVPSQTTLRHDPETPLHLSMMLDARWDDPSRLRSHSMPCLPERPIEEAESGGGGPSSWYLSNLNSVKLDPPSQHRRPRQSSFDSVFPAAAPTRFNEVVRTSLIRRTDQSPTKPRRSCLSTTSDEPLATYGEEGGPIRQAKMLHTGLEKSV
jgi:hypothetical protein